MRGVQRFVANHLGEQYVEVPPFDLAVCYKESVNTTPLIFVLSPGEGIIQCNEIKAQRKKRRR